MSWTDIQVSAWSGLCMVSNGSKGPGQVAAMAQPQKWCQWQEAQADDSEGDH